MSKPKVPRKAPENALLPLASLTIRRVESFSGKPLHGVERDVISTGDVALALDFLERIQYRRLEPEKKTWIDAETVTDRLHTLRKLIQVAPRILNADDDAYISEYDMADLTADILEYLTVRAELAGEMASARERRYMVTVDAPSLAAVPARTAVA